MTSRLRNWLNLTAISSVALLAATGGAVASSDLQLSGHDLDNFDTLAGVTYGVTSDRDVGSIINEGGASISTSIFGSIAGIYVDGTLGSLDNRGSISAVGVAAVYTLGLTTFNNSGDISFSHSGPMLPGPYAAVRVDGGTTSSFINSGTIQSDYSGVIFGGDVGTFINSGSIGGDAAINTSYSITTFTNTGAGTIGNIVVGGDITTFTNDGAIAGTQTLQAGSIDTFTNRGTIESDGTAVWVHADVGSFRNENEVYASSGLAVRIDGNVKSFINTAGASIGSDDTGYGAVKIGGNVDSFDNAGDIFSHLQAVEIVGNVGDFTNSGNLRGGYDTTANNVVIKGAVIGTFFNTASGTIDGTENGESSAGVYIEGDVNRFVNAGTIKGTTAAVQFGYTYEDTNHIWQIAAANVESFSNSGRIEGTNFGAIFYGDVSSFSNAGQIVSGGTEAVAVHGDVGSFVNTGTIRATGSSAYTAIYVDGPGTLFDNRGTIDGGTGYGAVFDQTLDAFSNAGTITGSYYGVEFSGRVGSFTNQAGGTITATDAGGTAVYTGGYGVEHFVNAGQIVSTGGNAVLAQTVEASDVFINTGTISGARSGVEFNFGIGSSFINTGTILGTGDETSFFGTITYAALSILHGSGGTVVNTGTMQDLGLGNAGIRLDGTSAYDGALDAIYNSGAIAGDVEGLYVWRASLGAIDNSGTISAAANSDSAGVLIYDAELGRLSNAAGGVITGPYVGVAVISASMASFDNAGLVHGGSFAGVAISSDGDFSLVNSGTIEGDRAVLADGTYTGSVSLTNSGLLRGTSGVAIDFAYDPHCGCNSPQVTRDDMLTLLTGSKIFGAVNFGQGNDDLDFSGFAGNTVLKVPGLDKITPGSRGYVWDKPNDQIAIFDVSGLDAGAIGQSWSDIGAAMFAFSQGQMDDASALDPGSSERSAYAPSAPETSAERATATAVMTELDTTQHLGVHGWASVIGGGSGGPSALDRLSLYGGIIAGSHARLSQVLTLGGMGGVVQATTSSLNGDEVLNSTTGSIGLYGSAQFGVADVDFSLLAGLTGNQSNRKVVAGGTTETAVGNFLSGTISPILAVSVPVLAADGTTLSLAGSASYTAGLVTGYAETGSSMNLTVGSQTIQVIDARVGFATKSLIATTDGATYALTAKAGMFTTSSFGSSSLPVTVLGQTTQLSTPGSTTYGIYTGVGVEGAITQTLHLGLNLDGSWRSDSIGSAGAKVTVGGVF